MNNSIARGDIASDKYLPTLDGWRAVAILLVIFAHSIYSIQKTLAQFNVYANLMWLAPLGLLGVHIFFVISGFLITRNMLSEEKSKGKLSISSFYYRRLFRIMPAAFVFLASIAILSWLKIISVNINEWFSALLFWANYTHAHKSWYTGHFWSLAVEEHFYIFWPFLFVLFKSNKKRAIFLICTAIIIAIWRAAAYKWWLTGDSAEYFWGRTDIQVDNIIFGALAAVIYEFDRSKKFITLLIKHRTIWTVAVIFIILIESFVDINGSMSLALLSFNPMLISIVMVCLIVYKRGHIFAVLENSWLKTIGIISYSTYLWQQLFCNRSDYNPPKLDLVQSFPLNVMLALGCATLSYKFVEMPMIRLGRRLSRPGRFAHGPLPVSRQPHDTAMEGFAAEIK